MTTKERVEGIENLVSSEIFTCQSSLVEEALTRQLFNVDDIENMYRPFDGKLLDPDVCVQCETKFGCLDSETGECEDCFEANQTPQEIYEWWIVSPWLGKKLLFEGEPIIDNNYGLWWGRSTTGQAISLDYVIQRIYDDLVVT